eukprot:4273233-Amphidinium_carterae.1
MDTILAAALILGSLSSRALIAAFAAHVLWSVPHPRNSLKVMLRLMSCLSPASVDVLSSNVSRTMDSERQSVLCFAIRVVGKLESHGYKGTSLSLNPRPSPLGSMGTSEISKHAAAPLTAYRNVRDKGI